MASPREPTPRTHADEAHAYAGALVGVAPLGIAFLDTAYRFQIVNETLAELNGVPRDAHLGRSVEEVLPHLWPRLRPIFDRVLDTGEPVTEMDLEAPPDSESAGRHWLANYYPVSASDGEVVGIGVVITEVTEHVRAAAEARRLEERAREAKLRQAQKMEAMGRLAGGVAHDFNNLLTVINGNCELLLSGAGDDEDHEALVSEVRDAGRRASALTRQLLAFTRQQMVSPRVLCLNGVVSSAEAMLGRLLGEDVLLTMELAPDTLAIVADPGQIEQVLVNLSVNARDAMPDGGCLTIRTARERGDRRAGSPECDGDVVVLSVSDSGRGIEEGVRERIFEPFFTTKPPGEGSGLGLSVVFGVVEDSGGTIDVESEPERGTTIRLRFPAVPGAAEEEASDGRADMPPGTETVLLVEDDTLVRAVAHRCLTLCGYRLLEAQDGAEALKVARSFDEPIHLLVTDVVMPHIGGLELAERLQADRPETAVLFVSGYTDDDVLRERVLGSELAFLQKPFAPSTLATRARKLLDTHRDDIDADHDPLGGHLDD